MPIIINEINEKNEIISYTLTQYINKFSPLYGSLLKFKQEHSNTSKEINSYLNKPIYGQFYNLKNKEENR